MTLRQRRQPPQRVAAAAGQTQPAGAAPAPAAPALAVGTPIQRVEGGYAPIIPDRTPGVAGQQTATGKNPKYLIRDDGMVMVWNPETAKDPRFRASNTLPGAHVRAAKDAAIRDSAEHDARVRYQNEQEEAKHRQELAQQAEEQRRRDKLLSLPENENPVEQLDNSIFQIDRANFEQLQQFCNDNEFEVELDPSLPLEQNQAIVRELCETNLGASMDQM